jgi:hypothetical protein
MTTNPTIDAFWQAYLASLPAGVERPTTYQAWSFGDDPDMADNLGHLVKTGIKTATCSLLWEPVPQVGDFSIWFPCSAWEPNLDALRPTIWGTQSVRASFPRSSVGTS